MKTARFRGFFQGEKGARTFNYLYSIGASVVILGALFKLLHVPFADYVLIVGMGTEAFIFFMSAFDEPAKDYKWENVFPVLGRADATPDDAPNFATGEGFAGGPQIVGGQPGGTIIIGGGSPVEGEVPAGGTTIIGGGVVGGPVIDGGGATPTISEEQSVALKEATDKYVSQLAAVTASLQSMQQSMQALGENQAYAEQMQTLTRNIQGLNTIYEIQLKSISSQLGTIEQVNQGLQNIRSLYENGQNDSFRIRQETDQMARTLQQLNQVYARMLQAMTVGVAMPQQQPFAQQPAQPFAQQPQGFTQPAQPGFAQ